MEFLPKQNKYSKYYTNLIGKARTENVNLKLCEKHHIKPKCLGGSNSSTNLVKMTPRQHFIAHMFLNRIYPEHEGLHTALFLMSSRSKVNSRLYEMLKLNWMSKMKAKEPFFKGKEHSKESKELMRDSKLGSKNHNYGKPRSNATKLKIAKSNKGKKRTNTSRLLMSERQKAFYNSISKRRQRAIWNGAKPFNVYKDNEIIGTWLMQKECAEELKLSKGHLNSCLHLKRRSHKGYTFKFKEEL